MARRSGVICEFRIPLPGVQPVPAPPVPGASSLSPSLSSGAPAGSGFAPEKSTDRRTAEDQADLSISTAHVLITCNHIPEATSPLRACPWTSCHRQGTGGLHTPPWQSVCFLNWWVTCPPLDGHRTAQWKGEWTVRLRARLRLSTDACRENEFASHFPHTWHRRPPPSQPTPGLLPV